MGWFFEDRAERLTDAQQRNRMKCKKKIQDIKRKIRKMDLTEDELFMFVVGIIVVFATAIISLS